MKISFNSLFLSLLAGTAFVHPVAAQFDENLRINGNGNGNGNSNGNNGNGNNGNGNGRANVQGAADCLAMYNPGICPKMETIAASVSAGTLDVAEEVKVLKNLMKEAKPVNPNKKNFKDKAFEILEKNKGQDKDQKTLLLEVVDALDSADLKTWILNGIETGVSELEDGVVMEPRAGELEDSVAAPPVGGRRRLGVPYKGNGALWPNKIVKFMVVAENDLSGWWTYTNHILPAMNILEGLTGLDFEYRGYVWTESSATTPGHLYVKINSAGCWAQGPYYSTLATKLNIGAGCTSSGIIQHELLHATGMLHQQQGCYRDKYIDVVWGNIQSGKSSNFDKLACNHGYESLYDYGSIMHYGEYSFSANGQKTINCRGRSCGQRTGLSIYDQWEMIWLYQGYYYVNGL